MKTSISIANESLSAVYGTATERAADIRKFATEPMPAGALINGVITDEQAFGYAVESLMKKLPAEASRDVRICLYSNRIYEKRVAVPPMKRKQMLEWMAGEFTDVGDASTFLYDYAILENDKNGARTALICAAQKELIAAYINVFEARGVTLSCIDTSLSAQIKLIKCMLDSPEGAFILLDLDGGNAKAALFVNGAFHFDNSVRLIAERGTPPCMAEIARFISSVIQFNATEHNNSAVTHVYMTGMKDEESELPAQLKTAFDVNAAPLTDARSFIRTADGTPLPVSAYACAVGNLIEL